MTGSGLRRLYAAVFLLLLVFNLWLAAQIPYGTDDWSWGSADGIRRFLHAEVNSRYAGNLTEILLTRLPLLKTLVMGLSFTLIPAAAVGLVAEGWELPEKELALPFLFLLGSLLMLTVPRQVWAQGYGWVAGFANFGFSGLLLCLYHRLLLRDETQPPAGAIPARRFLPLLLFALLLQLYIENLSFYALLLTGLLLFFRLRRKEPLSRLLPLFLGCALGAALIFGNPLFGKLLRDGEALGGYRSLSFSTDDGLFRAALFLLRRFLGDLVPVLLGKNWILCALSALLLAACALRRRQTALLAADLLYLFYFPFARFRGPVPLPEPFSVHYLSGLVEPLFFLLVLVQIRLCWREERRVRLLLFASWLALPVMIAPMAVINTVGARSYLTTDILFMQFVLLLASRVWIGAGRRTRRAALALCAAALCAVCVQRAHIYAEIGAVKRAQETAIREGVASGAAEIRLPAQTHTGWLWGENGRGGADIGKIRRFYGIPEDVELIFENAESTEDEEETLP